MSDYIPFEIQSEIIKRLPVKSLVQFRSVSKQWKSFIDCPEFIKTYHINHPNPQHHLLLQYKVDLVPTYTSIVDDITFPQQKLHLTPPEPLSLLKQASIVGSVSGVVCISGWYEHTSGSKMCVLWNPNVRKCVGIPVPKGFESGIAFGVCPETNDPKLVAIKVHNDRKSWEVQVFSLSSRVWKTLDTVAPLMSFDWLPCHVFIDGIIYWYNPRTSILSFDLKSEEFGEVCLPETLAIPLAVKVAKVNESLGLFEFYEEGGMVVCGVWMRKDGVNQPFTKMYTIRVLEGEGEGKFAFYSVLGFRNNGEVVLRLDDDDDSERPQVKVYEPSSGRVNIVGISGDFGAFGAGSYMETLLLLDQSNSIIG